MTIFFVTCNTTIFHTILDFRTSVRYNIFGATLFGRRLASTREL